MDLKRTKQTMLILAVIAAALVMLAAVNVLFLVLAAAIAMVIAIINQRYWRCPYCQQHLGRDVSRYCTHCGKELEL